MRDRSLVFEANVFDKALGGEGMVLPFDEIAGFGRREGEMAIGNLFSGGLRARLLVERKSGPPELFVVPRLDEVIAELSALHGATA